MAMRDRACPERLCAQRRRGKAQRDHMFLRWGSSYTSPLTSHIFHFQDFAPCKVVSTSFKLGCLDGLSSEQGSFELIPSLLSSGLFVTSSAHRRFRGCAPS